MNKAIIIPNFHKDVDLSITKLLVEKLLSLGIYVYIDEKYYFDTPLSVKFCREYPPDADFITVVGGDGSIIDASVLAISMDIPLIGVNLGRVGYLSAVDPHEIWKFEKLISGGYVIDEKMLLAVEKVASDGKRIVSDRLAVNDIVVRRAMSPGICTVRVDTDSCDRIEYRSDGVIFSTPVGSTAYSLSAGGPVLSHRLESILLTPICPHTLFNRSIVFPTDEILTVTNLDNVSMNVSVDGRFFIELMLGESCRIYRSKKMLKMIRLENENMFSSISRKITLLQDIV